MNAKRLVIVSAVTLFALFITKAAVAQSPKNTVTGILSATGEKSPAWRIELDEPLVLEQRVFDFMEVYSRDEDLSPLAGKRVAATGTFVQWRTPERGKFIVLEICEIVPADQ